MTDLQTTEHAIAVRDFIESTVLFGDSNAISDDDSLTETGVLDSTGILEVISFLEHRYSITFDDSDLVASNFDSINRIASFVATKIV
jgi:acyl carrier protein